MNIGERIARERKRLGQSQAGFAKRVGVSLSSQKRYESGERTPDVEYLAAIAPLGVDINYVLNGDDAYVSKFDIEHGHVFIAAIEMTFGISQQDLETVIDKSLGEGIMDGYDPAIFFEEMLRVSSIFRLMADKYAALDTSILSLTLQGVEDAAAKAELKITAAKKAGAVVMLYRAFKVRGKVDHEMIEDAVKLAAS